MRKGFRVFDSARTIWFWWDGEEYSHWWDTEGQKWVKYSPETAEHHNSPPENEPRLKE